jgi:hypothetical protein
MNIETNTGENMNDPAVLDERIASVINTLIQVADPRLVVNSLLGNAAALTEIILRAEKATPAQVAQAFSSALIQALTPTAENAPRIEVVPAGVIPLRPR